MTSGRCHCRRAASPTPLQTSNSLKDQVHRRDDISHCRRRARRLSSLAKRKQEGRSDLRERPFRGSIRTGSRAWGGTVGGGVRGGRGIAPS